MVDSSTATKMTAEMAPTSGPQTQQFGGQSPGSPPPTPPPPRKWIGHPVPHQPMIAARTRFGIMTSPPWLKPGSERTRSDSKFVDSTYGKFPRAQRQIIAVAGRRCGSRSTTFLTLLIVHGGLAPVLCAFVLDRGEI